MRKTQWKKAVSIFFGVLLTVFALTGCLQTDAGKAESKKETTADMGNSPGEITELSVMIWNIDGLGKDETAPITKLLIEKLGVRFIPISTPFNNFNDRLNTLIASGEIPDIFWFRGESEVESYRRYIKDGLVLCINEEIKKYPNLEKHLHKFEDIKNLTDGKFYGVPVQNQVQDTALINPHTYYFRKDWLDKLGLSVPRDLAEFKNVITAFAKRDPDGNQKDDTYGLSAMSPDSIWFFYPLFNANLSDLQRMEKVNGKWQPMLFNDGGLATVKLLNELYRGNILDSEFMLNTQDKMVEKFATGKVGCILLNTGNFYPALADMFTGIYEDQDYKSMFTYSEPLYNISGKQSINGFNNFWGLGCISGKSSPKKQEKALSLFDFIASEEGRIVFRYGIEGVTFKREGATIINLSKKSEEGYPLPLLSIDPAVMLQSFLFWDSNFASPGVKYEKEIFESSLAWSKGLQKDPLNLLYIPADKLEPQTIASCWDFTVETLTKIIAKSNNVDEDFARYKSDWLNKGGQKIIDEINAAAAEAGK